MKTPPLAEADIAQLLSEELGLAFGSAKRVLGSWGQADRCVELTANRWVLLEVEGSQHHPNTNVLKLWPFLEEQLDLSVLLVHVFASTARNRGSTRGRLAEWLARRMEQDLKGRFAYHRVLIGGAGAAVDLDRLRRAVAAFHTSIPPS
jgi:hypothetical protein